MTAPFLSSRVPYLRDGVTPAGSRIVCPRSERRFRVPVWVRYTSQFMVGPHASVCGVSARPVLQGVLPGPRCVRELRLSLAPSSVLHCPVLWFSVTSTTLAAGLGLSWVPCPTFCRLGFCSSVGDSACALQPLAPSSRLVLTEAAGLGGFLVLSFVLPWPYLLPGPPALLCLLPAGCFLGLEPSPLGEASASA